MSFSTGLNAVVAGTANIGSVQNEAMAINNVIDNILNPVTDRHKKKKKRFQDRMTLLDQAALAGGIYTGFTSAYDTGMNTVISKLLPTRITKEGKVTVDLTGFIPTDRTGYIEEPRNTIEDDLKIEKLKKSKIVIDKSVLGWAHLLDSYSIDDIGNIDTKALDSEGTYAAGLHEKRITEEQYRSESELESDPEAINNSVKILKGVNKYKNVVTKATKLIKEGKQTGKLWGENAFYDIKDVKPKTVKHVANSLIHHGDVLDNLLKVANERPDEFKTELTNQILLGKIGINDLKTLTGMLLEKEGLLKGEGSSELTETPLIITKKFINQMRIINEGDKELDKATSIEKVHKIAADRLNELNDIFHDKFNTSINIKLVHMENEEISNGNEFIKNPSESDDELEQALKQKQETLEILTDPKQETLEILDTPKVITVLSESEDKDKKE